MEYKSKTYSVLMDYFRNNGYTQLVSSAKAMLEADVRDKKSSSFVSDMHGEVAEVVLECGIYDAVKRLGWKKEDWRLEKSLILKDLDSNNKAFFTELDVVLFTPYRILAFEAKSYQGNKTLTGKGILKSKHGSVDVYKQHSQHMHVLTGNFDAFKLNIETGLPLYSMFLFDFSHGALEDLREPSYKALLPVVHYNNIYTILTGLGNKKIWNMKLLNRALDIIKKNESDNRKKHLAYVRGLKHNGDR